MDKLVLALAPAFAAGFALQQLLELLDSFFAKIKDPADKKLLMSVVSLVVGLILAFAAGLRVLQPLGVTQADILDGIVTGLIISAGTEGFNSILKFLGYAKEERKAESATKKKHAENEDALSLVERT